MQHLYAVRVATVSVLVAILLLSLCGSTVADVLASSYTTTTVVSLQYRIDGLAVAPSEADDVADAVFVSSLRGRGSYVAQVNFSALLSAYAYLELVAQVARSVSTTTAPSALQSSAGARRGRHIDEQDALLERFAAPLESSWDGTANVNLSVLVDNRAASGGCIPGNDTAFSDHYAVTPNALGVALSSAGRWSVFVADRVPSSRIYELTVGAGNVTWRPDALAGKECSYVGSFAAPPAAISPTPVVATSVNLRNPSDVVCDPVTGKLYVSQFYSVIEISRDQGLMQAFFANESRPANRSADTFNNEDIPRLSATTLHPAQVAIDAVARVMYVAEVGLSTVRAINVTSGVSRIVLGSLLWLTAFPSPWCDQNCTVDQVNLITPVAVAVYRSRSGSTETAHLFVGDLTASVIYRLDLLTDKVTIVAGQMLSTGAQDGGPGTSRLYSLSRLAVGRRHLYIADNSLRVIELRSAERALPSSSSETPTEAAASALVTATVAGSVIAGGAATADAVVLIMVAGVTCNGKPSKTTSIVQDVFLFADAMEAPEIKPWVMLSVLLAFLLLHMASGYAAYVIRDAPKGSSSLSGFFQGKNSSTAKFPSQTLAFTELIGPLMLFISWRSVLSSSSSASTIASSVFALVVGHVAMLVGFRVLVKTFVLPRAYFAAYHWRVTSCTDAFTSPINTSVTSKNSTAGSSTSPGNGSVDGNAVNTSGSFAASFTSLLDDDAARAPPITAWEQYVLAPGRWEPKDVSASFGSLFSKYSPEFRAIKPLELLLPLASALLTAVASSQSSIPACQGSMSILALVYFCSSVMVVYFRPYRRPLDNWLTPLSSLLFSVVCICKVFNAVDVAALVQLLQAIVMMIKVASGVYCWFRERRYHAPSDGRQSPMSHEHFELSDKSAAGNDMPVLPDNTGAITKVFSQSMSGIREEMAFFTKMEAREEVADVTDEAAALQTVAPIVVVATHPPAKPSTTKSVDFCDDDDL